MQQTKELFINAVRQLRIQGHSVVPTVVAYKDKRCLAGYEAIEGCERLTDLKEDFKVQLGNEDPMKLARKRVSGFGPIERSVLGVAKDFIETVTQQALTSLERQGFEKPTRILVAEPLSLADSRLVHDDWLKNYRGSIRSILGTRFKEVDFMPEPFAVFQYYRYGIRHALVAQKLKHVALVFDFGGGPSTHA